MPVISAIQLLIVAHTTASFLISYIHSNMADTCSCKVGATFKRGPTLMALDLSKISNYAALF
jgi:uncharacterized membrane protein